MIVDYEYKNGKLLVSHISDKGQLQFKNYDWYNPLQWNLTTESDPQKSDKFKTWNKKPVKLDKTRYPNRYAIYEKFRKLPEKDQSDIFDFHDPNIFFCDIEVEITQGFPEAHIAENKVTSVALIHKNTILLLGIKELTDKQVNKMTKDVNEYFSKFNTNYKVKWQYCETEYELMDILFNELIPKMPILTGWNFIKYDWVYLVTRARKLGINPDVASPSGKLEKPWSKNENEYKPIYEELPRHRLVFDYMDIFDKWDQSIDIKEAISLDFVSSKVLDVKKLEYDGSLKQLYHDDWYKYCLYNCIDTALVQLIHQKQQTFDIMLSIATLAKIDIKSALSTIRVTEGVLFDKFYDNGIVMVKQKNNNNTIEYDDDDKEVNTDDGGYGGGYVKYPARGLRLWVCIFDYASLYPNTMIQFNIAPESFKGMKINDEYTMLDGMKFKIEDDDIILPNGAVFKNENSYTKQILSSIFKNRKGNKNLSLDYYKQHKLITDYLKNRKAA